MTTHMPIHISRHTCMHMSRVSMHMYAHTHAHVYCRWPTLCCCHAVISAAALPAQNECIDMCVDMYIDMSIHMCIDMPIHLCIDMSIHMCTDMCRHVCGHVCRHKSRHVCGQECRDRHWLRHGYRHSYRYCNCVCTTSGPKFMSLGLIPFFLGCAEPQRHEFWSGGSIWDIEVVYA